MAYGKLITIEGTDGSGKHTQTELLCNALAERGCKLCQLSFPCYNSPSSALVKMYLGGEFGTHPDAVNPYAASSFFAVDRYASYKKDWEKNYQNGELIITDRYTVSNAIHQGAKLPPEKRNEYLDWLYEFEYGKMGIPAPDLVIYLDVPTELTSRLRREREAKMQTKPDIHEKDEAYLKACRDSALDIAAYSGWEVISCATSDGTAMRSPEDIHKDILSTVLTFSRTWEAAEH